MFEIYLQETNGQKKRLFLMTARCDSIVDAQKQAEKKFDNMLRRMQTGTWELDIVKKTIFISDDNPRR